MDENFLEELITRNGFIVKVNLVEEEEPECDFKLEVDYAGKKNEVYELFLSPEFPETLLTINGEPLTLRNCMTRLYILCNIYLQCRKLKLPYTIIRFYKSGKQSELIDLLSIEMNEVDQQAEMDLHEAMISILENNSAIHSFDETFGKLGLEQQFNLLKGLLV
jgi:hypothetical protein